MRAQPFQNAVAVKQQASAHIGGRQVPLPRQAAGLLNGNAEEVRHAGQVEDRREPGIFHSYPQRPQALKNAPWPATSR